MIETKARPSTWRGGRWSNFSISGSGCHLRLAWWRAGARSSRQPVQRLRAEHQVDGARVPIRRPSWLATQPPTPMCLGLRCLTRPQVAGTPSPAFSRTEQVLNGMRSAACSEGRPVGSCACAALNQVRTSCRVVLVIWHPRCGCRTCRRSAMAPFHHRVEGPRRSLCGCGRPGRVGRVRCRSTPRCRAARPPARRSCSARPACGNHQRCRWPQAGSRHCGCAHPVPASRH